jgi:ketosteroid isomerase-like protein
MSANTQLVKSLYTAFAQGDVPAVIGSLDPGIVWNEAENFPYADRNPYIGPQAVAEGVFFRLATEWEGFQAIPNEFLDAGDTIITLGRYKATHKASGKVLDAQFAHVFRVTDGKIKALQQYTDTLQASRVMQGGATTASA